MPFRKILWVGSANLDRLRQELEREGVQSVIAESVAEATDCVDEGVRPDLVVLGPALAPRDAEVVASALAKSADEVPLVVVAPGENPLLFASGMEPSVLVSIEEPDAMPRLTREISRLLDRGAKERSAEADKAEDDAGSFHGIVGRNPRTREMIRQIRTMADLSLTVLVRGESGTGKELVARALHEASARRTEPFLAINCAAIPPPLLESTLFGHVRGAFTGAETDSEGFFVAARRGTLFLDEIAELPPVLQAKLLRSLQEREVVPVGSSRPIEWHARIVCATNVDLEARVREGQFRRDLYYRVHVLELRVPPLRERQSDIPLLVESFLERHEARLGPARRISDTALRILEAYPWPGNVRELENVILRASVSATGSVIEPSDLYKVLPLSFEQQDVSDTVFPSYDQLSVDHIVRALRLSRGVQTMAARLLGMDRNRLARLIRRYQIDPRQIARETGRGSRGRRRGRGGDPQREPDAER